MNRLSIPMAIVLAIVLFTASFYLGRVTKPNTVETPGAPASSASGASRKVLYWHDPMVPAQRFDKPGKSPFMDMPLVPVYADSAPDSPGVAISPGLQQNLGIRYAVVRRADVSSSFDAIGTVQFDDRRSVSVQSRVAGFVERLAVRAPMERVQKGQVLATVFAPDWLGPQNELLALKRAGVAEEVVAAARERMRALSIPPELVRQSEATGIAQARYALTAPISGVVAELGVREGVAVAPGTTLFRIAGLDKVWAIAEIPEAQALRLGSGQKVSAALQADAAQTFNGVLTEIVPEVSATSRTLKARFEVDNRDGRLTPGMLLRLRVQGPATSRLVVASEAVIRTGSRTVAIVRNDKGAFEPREVSVGADAGDDVEIVKGLREGEQVVASGQFLVDSEARLRSVLGNMTMAASGPASASASVSTLASASASATASATASASALTSASAPSTANLPPSAAPAPQAAATKTHMGEGRVEKVAADAITISHGPVDTLQWPAMTMGFAKPSPAAFPAIQPGDRVHFEFRAGGPSGYELVAVQKLAAGARQ